MDNFTNFGYVMTFAGMVITVVLITQFIKGFFTKVHTKYIVLAIAFILSVVAAIFYGDVSSLGAALQTVVTWFINMIIVWFSAMKSFEIIKGE